jgi:hypothetical protein
MSTSALVGDVDTNLPADENVGGGLLDDIGQVDTTEDIQDNGGIVDDQQQEDGQQQQETDGVTGKQQADSAQQAKDQVRSEVTKYLRELRNNDQLKSVADALNKAWFREQEYSSLGDVKELREIKQQLDVLGGPEALSRFRDLEIAVEGIDQMVDEGNPAVLDDMFSESPEGMKKIVPAAIDKLKVVDPAAYANTIRPHIVEAIQGTNLQPTVHSVAALIQKAYNAQDPEHSRFYMEQAFNHVRDIDSWLGGLSAESKQQPQTPTQTAQAPQGNDLQAQVASQLVPWARQEFERALKPMMGTAQISPEKMNDLLTLMANEVDRRLESDENFKSNFNAWQRAGKADRMLRQAKNGISGMVGEVARQIWDRHGVKTAPARQGSSAVAQRKTAATTDTRKNSASSIKNAVLLPRKPSMDQLDLSRDPERLLYMTHRGYLKDGRLVQWK